MSYPSEYIKTVMQLSALKKKKSAFHHCKMTFKQGGILGFYRSFSAPLLFSIPKAGIRFGLFSKIKQLQIFEQSQRLNTFVSGLLAGTIEALLVLTP